MFQGRSLGDEADFVVCQLPHASVQVWNLVQPSSPQRLLTVNSLIQACKDAGLQE